MKFIDDILDDVLSRNNLPETVITTKGENVTADAFNLNEVVRPTKITARALRAKLWVYAASPLFNGGWDKAMELKDADGTQLFHPRILINGLSPSSIWKNFLRLVKKMVMDSMSIR